MDTSERNLHWIIKRSAQNFANQPALSALGRAHLDYAALLRQVDQTVDTLNELGIGKGDRVAMVLPNGPEMAAAFVAIACAATVAPLNPAYTAEEFDFYLADLDVRALVLMKGSQSPAAAVAARRGISILTLRPDPTAAGAFSLDGRATHRSVVRGIGEPSDVALLLHTSGTTARPKMVPLSQANLVASIRAIRRTVALTPDDICLNVMPLFHIHGLAAALLASLSAGSSVVCSSGFEALGFFRWLDETRPTWYTAVPTMHHAIVARAARNPEVIAKSRLRLVRSSSAALPPKLMTELEQVFGCPAIEAYGMTEAAHQMASNPLPPGKRKPGSVGVATGTKTAIMDSGGALLPPEELGEVVIRGENVTCGYLGDGDANTKAFTDGWFRTGDQGYMDAEGYLFLTGRLKELINRGGEKISPRQIDEVLLDHPSVKQAVAFGNPHRALGEEVAAVVVLHPGSGASGKDLRRFVADRLADFKVPRRILFVSEIPMGPSGKLQRIGLAEKLGLTD